MDISKELQQRKTRRTELETELQTPEVQGDQNKLKTITQEYIELGEILALGEIAEKNNWKTSLISQNQTDIGGFKELVFEISGRNVYRSLKYEAGVHRVQRI